MAALGSSFAQASIFQKAARFAPDDAGYTTIPVCLIDGSTTRQKSARCPGCAHAGNPGLTQVVTHVKHALAQSWEAHSGVRFVGFDWCRNLATDGGEVANTVGLFIHPRADNAAFIGTDTLGSFTRENAGISFKPWGNSAACIGFEVSAARMDYRFECVEQYAIHEFGHVLGFVHEWTHPDKPVGCNDGPRNTEPLSTDGGYTIVNPAYDWDSVMAYTDACAHVTGVRFGSPNLSPIDIAGLEAAYPKGSGPDAARGMVVPDLGDDHPATDWPARVAIVPVGFLIGIVALRRRYRRK
jgi:hypothetical protein